MGRGGNSSLPRRHGNVDYRAFGQPQPHDGGKKMRRTIIAVASSTLLFAGCASTPDEQPTATQAAPAAASSETPRAQARPADRRAAAPAAPAEIGRASCRERG